MFWLFSWFWLPLFQSFPLAIIPLISNYPISKFPCTNYYPPPPFLVPTALRIWIRSDQDLNGTRTSCFPNSKLTNTELDPNSTYLKRYTIKHYLSKHSWLSKKSNCFDSHECKDRIPTGIRNGVENRIWIRNRVFGTVTVCFIPKYYDVVKHSNNQLPLHLI